MKTESMNEKIIHLVHCLFYVENYYKYEYGYKFKVVFNDYPVGIDVVTLNGRCELGICSYNGELDNNIAFKVLMLDLENSLEEIKKNK